MHSANARIDATRQFHYKVWGLTVWEVLTCASFAAIARDLDCVELWCGVGAIWKAAAAQGHKSRGFDLNNDVAENMLTEQGFLKALELTLRLATTGMLWMAPVCSSWVFLNLKNTMRHANIWGNRFCQAVRDGNAMAISASFLFLVSWARGVFAAMENPVNSFFFKFPPVALASRLVNGYYQTTPRCAWCSQPLGQRWLKRYKFQATSSWVSPLWMPCPCGKGNHKSLVVLRVSGARKKIHGRRSALTASAAYPASLGVAIVAAWRQAKRLTSSQTQGTKPWKRSTAEAFHAPQNIRAPKHEGKSRKGSVGAPRQATAATVTGHRSQAKGRKVLVDARAAYQSWKDQRASDSPQPYRPWKDQCSDGGAQRGSQVTGGKALAPVRAAYRSWKDQWSNVSSREDTMEGALMTKTRPSWKWQV